MFKQEFQQEQAFELNEVFCPLFISLQKNFYGFILMAKEKKLKQGLNEAGEVQTCCKDKK